MILRQEIKDLEERIATMEDSLKFLQSIGDLPDELQNVRYNEFAKALQVKTLDEVNLLRKHLIKRIGWRDKLGHSWWGGSHMITEWKSDYHDAAVWLFSLPDEFPKELQSDKCKLVRKQVKEPAYEYTSYEYTCVADEETDNEQQTTNTKETDDE